YQALLLYFHSAQFDQIFHPLADLSVCQGLKFPNGEIFYAKRSHGGSVHQGHFHLLESDLILSRQVTHKSTGEGIARSSRIRDFGQGESWSKEHIVFAEH